MATPSPYKRLQYTLKCNLKSAIDLSKEIVCFSTPQNYFNRHYRLLLKKEKELASLSKTPENKSISKYLKNAECSYVSRMYKDICEKLKNKGYVRGPNTIADFNDIKAKDILLVQCPTIFGDHYHFLTAVVDNSGINVDIYQSYGIIPLNKKTIPLARFVELLGDIVTLLNMKKNRY